MSHTFHVDVRDVIEIEEIDGTWTADDFRALLDAMDFGDHAGMAEDELREMCLMSLQDQDPNDAAYLVLRYVIGDALRDGQLRNMSSEMQDEKLWEEYVDPAFHERLFRVGSLLYAARPQVFPKTDAVRVTLEVRCPDAEGRALFDATPDEAFLVRLVADGMDARAVLHRFYGDQMKQAHFPEAPGIVWISEVSPAGPEAWTVELIGSHYWLGPLDDTKSFESNAA
ncbi:hypothetical protein [Minwuia sp.]|uniref:hypothetical protein n=1 Tax=Minwuia sp. TaxID=2493630 RepID=UPI003A8E9F9D